MLEKPTELSVETNRHWAQIYSGYCNFEFGKCHYFLALAASIDGVAFLIANNSPIGR